MFNRKEFKEIKKVLDKIELDKKISVSERLMVEKYAKGNLEIFQLLKRAQCKRRLNTNEREEITDFLGSLSLNGTFTNEHYNQKKETIEEWFTNAPNWLRRS